VFSLAQTFKQSLLALLIGAATSHLALAAAPAYTLGFSSDTTYTSGAISGDTVAARSATSTDIYYKSTEGWALQASIASGNPAAFFDAFDSVSVSGDTLLIGQTANEQAQIYTRSGTTWTLQQTLTNPDGTANDMTFGANCAVLGDTAYIADPSTPTINGHIYVYHRTAGVWSLQQSFGSTNPGKFGFRLAIGDGTTLLSPVYSSANLTGDIVAFNATEAGYVQGQTLISNSPSFYAVSLVGDTATSGGNGSAANVFTRQAGTWALDQQLPASSDSLVASPNRVLIANASNNLVTIYDNSGTSWTSVGTISTRETNAHLAFGATHIMVSSTGATDFYDDANGVDSSTAISNGVTDRIFADGFDGASNVTLTAVVTGTAPIGQVIFRNGDVAFDGCNAVNVTTVNSATSTATCVAYLPSGENDLVTAEYLGDGVNRTSVSPPTKITFGQ
jgi:hypothetical protein